MLLLMICNSRILDGCLKLLFLTKMENGESKQEGLCIKCAKELGLKPVDDLMKKTIRGELDEKGLEKSYVACLNRGVGLL